MTSSSCRTRDWTSWALFPRALYVDGIVGDVGHGVLRDLVVVAAKASSGEIIGGPEIITRGWVFAPEDESLLEEARERVRRDLLPPAGGGVVDPEALKRISASHSANSSPSALVVGP